ncbi:ATP synthase F1 epsilon subunit [Bradyrhizobium sp. LB7.2]
MATFHFDLVSPEKLAFSGEVDQVDIPGVEGDFGVLAGHAPVVAAIRPGILTITTGGKHEKIIVLGGLAEVSEKGLTVLADVATSLAELDRAQFAATVSEMEEWVEGARRQRARSGHRAARPLQEHPAAAQQHGYALSPGASHRGSSYKFLNKFSARHGSGGR